MGITERVVTNSLRNDRWLTTSSQLPDWARLIDINSPEYPANLAAVDRAPSLLSVAGAALRPHLPHIAIVGSRDATEEGLTASNHIASGIAINGGVVVSGLAAGVDTVAHSGALSSGAPTVAVVGSGMGTTYPVANRHLQSEVLRHGTLVSQFEFGQRPSKTTFPARNAVIVGMSHAVVVVQMSERGGTRVVVELALEMRRPVLLWAPLLAQQPWAHQLASSRPGVRFISEPVEALRSASMSTAPG